MVSSYFAGSLIHTRNVDSRDELDGGWLVWILAAAVDVDTVYAVLMRALLSG